MIGPSSRHLAVWWGITGSPMLLAVGAVFAIGMNMLQDVVLTLRHAEVVRQQVEDERARFVAEAAVQACAGGEFVLGRDRATVSVAGGQLHVVVDAAGGDRRCFAGEVLPGAGPAELAQALAARDPDGLANAVPFDRACPPALDRNALAAAIRADLVSALRRDRSIALLHWDVGTEGDDFVFAGGGRRAIEVAGDLIVVPGHLWLEPGPEPFELTLRSDLVVVVQGNLYLGRSLRVVGGGRLLMATDLPAGAASFADRDGNGRWSEGDVLHAGGRFRGPVEGGGNVYLGLRCGSPSIDCGAGLFVAGELHVAADAKVAGPVVLSYGATRLGAGARLHAAGEWRFRPDRERVPGFTTTGPPRPSVLRSVAQPALHRPD